MLFIFIRLVSRLKLNFEYKNQIKISIIVWKKNIIYTPFKTCYMRHRKKHLFIIENSRPHELQQNVRGLDGKDSYKQTENIHSAGMRSWWVVLSSKLLLLVKRSKTKLAKTVILTLLLLLWTCLRLLLQTRARRNKIFCNIRQNCALLQDLWIWNKQACKFIR